MSEKPRGIVDPWRCVEPLRPSARPPRGVRKDLKDIDLDADLAIPGRWTLRFEHASIEVSHVRVEAPVDALDVVAECLREASRAPTIAALLRDLRIGVRVGSSAWNAPATEASSLEGGLSTIWFAGQDLEHGVLALARALRSPSLAPIARKWGVTPMTK